MERDVQAQNYSIGLQYSVIKGSAAGMDQVRVWRVWSGHKREEIIEGFKNKAAGASLVAQW